MLRRRSAVRRVQNLPSRLLIEARQFVEAARERGFHWYAGVPCSYLTPFINYVLQDESLHYMSMTNEGDAVALIAGVALAGVADYALKSGTALTGKRPAAPAVAVIQPHRVAPLARPSRHEALREVVAQTLSSATAVLASTGFCGRELYAAQVH